jgi:hypothetical protein
MSIQKVNKALEEYADFKINSSVKTYLTELTEDGTIISDLNVDELMDKFHEVVDVFDDNTQSTKDKKHKNKKIQMKDMTKQCTALTKANSQCKGTKVQDNEVCAIHLKNGAVNGFIESLEQVNDSDDIDNGISVSSSSSSYMPITKKIVKGATPPVVNSNVSGCTYKLNKGINKGTRCHKRVSKGEWSCAKHKKKSIINDMPSEDIEQNSLDSPEEQVKVVEDEELDSHVLQLEQIIEDEEDDEGLTYEYTHQESDEETYLG